MNERTTILASCLRPEQIVLGQFLGQPLERRDAGAQVVVAPRLGLVGDGLRQPGDEDLLLHGLVVDQHAASACAPAWRPRARRRWWTGGRRPQASRSISPRRSTPLLAVRHQAPAGCRDAAAPPRRSAGLSSSQAGGLEHRGEHAREPASASCSANMLLSPACDIWRRSCLRAIRLLRFPWVECAVCRALCVEIYTTAPAFGSFGSISAFALSVHEVFALDAQPHGDGRRDEHRRVDAEAGCRW